MGVKAGIPDLCLPVPRGEYSGLYIEMKFEKGRLEESQKKMLRLLTKQGHFCAVCYGAEEAIYVLKQYLSLEKEPISKRYIVPNPAIYKNGEVKVL